MTPLDPTSPGFRQFIANLKGWMCNADGEDFCPTCWAKWQAAAKAKFGEDAATVLADCSSFVADLAQTRQASDGWYVYCLGKESSFVGNHCDNNVFVPFTAQEAEWAQTYRREKRERSRRFYTST